jgi:hypothetical protein
LLAAALAVALISPSAFAGGGGFTFTVDDVAADAGEETIVVPITITNNPGFGGWVFDIEVESDALALKSAEMNAGSVEASTNDNRVFIENWTDPWTVTIPEFTINLTFTKNVQSGTFKITIEHDKDSCVGLDWYSFDLSTVTTIPGFITINGGDPEPDSTDCEYSVDGYAAKGHAGYGGTITVDETGQFTVTATAMGYVIDEIVVDGVPLGGVQEMGSATYTFPSDTTGDSHSVVASFAHTVNFNSPLNGALSVKRGNDTLERGDIVRDGEELTIIPSPDQYYELADLTLNGFEDNSPAPNQDGSYTVTVLAKRGGTAISIDVSFTLADTTPRYGVTKALLTNGDITGLPAKAAEGETVSFTVAPASGQGLAARPVMNTAGGTVAVTRVSGYNYRFTMPDEDVEVSASFSGLTGDPVSFQIVPENHGTMYVVDDFNDRAVAGSHVRIRLTPINNDWTLADSNLAINYNDEFPLAFAGENVEEGWLEYTFTMPQVGYARVYAVLVNHPYYTISQDAGIEHGELSIVPTARQDTTVTVTYKPDANYRLTPDSLKVIKAGGGSVTTNAVPGKNEYFFHMPAEPVTVTAAFDMIPFQIKQDTVYNGKISITPLEGLPGAPISVTVEPNHGYRFDAESPDSLFYYYGSTLDRPDIPSFVRVKITDDGGDGVYTFEMPVHDITVAANFTAIPTNDDRWLGLGTAEEPWLIEDEADFIALRDAVNGAGNAPKERFDGKHFLLTADLDLTKFEKNWEPVGSASLKLGGVYYNNKYAAIFGGTFDGGEHEIKFFAESEETYGGNLALFYQIDGATVRNLTARGEVHGYVGLAGLVGSVYNSLIENCVNYVDVYGSYGAGGLIGDSWGDTVIKDCVNYGNVRTTYKSGAGGILCMSYGSVTIISSFNHGDVHAGTTSTGIGGILGGGSSGNRAVVINCGNTGDVYGVEAHGIGGGIATGCWNTGNITAGLHASGIGGTVITDCYNSGNVTVTGSGWGRDTHPSAGGIETAIALPDSVYITNCYNSGIISSPEYAGAIVGYDARKNKEPNFVTNCYYLDGSVVAGEYIMEYGEIAKTAEEFKTLASALGDAFVDGPGGYPILIPQELDDSVTFARALSGTTVEASLSGAGLTQFINGEGDYAISFDLGWGGGSDAARLAIAPETLRAMKNFSASLALKTDVGDYAFSAPALARIANEAGENGAEILLRRVGADSYEISVASNGAPLFTGGAGGGEISITVPYARKDPAKLVRAFRLTDGEKVDTGASYLQGDGIIILAADRALIFSIEEIDRTQTGDNGESRTGVDAVIWDGVSVDVRWYEPDRSVYHIRKPAELAGLAAIVNGLVNEGSVIYGDEGHTKLAANEAGGGSAAGNLSTAIYHYGTDDFNGKTVYLDADIDMGGSDNNFMPIGGQYLMERNNAETKLSSSFCGTLDGQGHWIRNIYTDRYCSTGNYGDGASVGLIGRLGVHDSDPENTRPVDPSVRNLAVTGYVKGNRHVGGIVGKIGKTSFNNGDGSTGGIIENCANFVTVVGTDAKGTGGIVGAAWNGGAVRNCYNAGTVNGGWPAGGIAGESEILIENCYNVGTVTSNSGAAFAMALGTRGSGYNHEINNLYYLEGSAAGGGYYLEGYVDETGERDAGYMKTDDFVADLTDADGNNAFVKDTGHINGGYPVLAWQGGTAVTPGAVDNTNDNETEADSTTTVEGDSATTVVSEPVKLGETPTLVIINVDTDGATVSSITAEVTAENVKAIAENGSSIEVRSDLGSVTLPNAAVTDLAGKSDEKLDVKLTKDSEDTYTFALTADDKAIAAVDGGVKLTLSAEDADAGTVAVLIHEDGSEEVIKKSVGKDGTVSVPLEGSATVKLVDNAKDFGDVADGAWYNDAVRFASSHELLTGTGGGKFSPDASMTRGMLVTVLYRLENEPPATGETFADVASDAYYADAVTWASANSIVLGTGNGFAPKAPITREQLAVMLYRYTEWLSAGDGGPGTVAPTDADLSGFPDADGVSEYAEDAMKWAVAAGLIQGRDSGLAPKGTATRAEVATILQRFIEQL